MHRAALATYDFDRIYGAWWERVVASKGKETVRRSAERYIRALHSCSTTESWLNVIKLSAE